jgi:hypothetical protein
LIHCERATSALDRTYEFNELQGVSLVTSRGDQSEF